jgi:hypothetical protein
MDLEVIISKPQEDLEYRFDLLGLEVTAGAGAGAHMVMGTTATVGSIQHQTTKIHNRQGQMEPRDREIDRQWLSEIRVIAIHNLSNSLTSPMKIKMRHPPIHHPINRIQWLPITS